LDAERETALAEISKRCRFPNTAVGLCNSADIATLIEEIVYIHPMLLSSSTVTSEAADRVGRALHLLQYISIHPEINKRLVEG